MEAGHRTSPKNRSQETGPGALTVLQGREEGMKEGSLNDPGAGQSHCPLGAYALEELLDNKSIHNTIKFQLW